MRKSLDHSHSPFRLSSSSRAACPEDAFPLGTLHENRVRFRCRVSSTGCLLEDFQPREILGIDHSDRTLRAIHDDDIVDAVLL
jgi:hypothetical protein